MSNFGEIYLILHPVALWLRRRMKARSSETLLLILTSSQKRSCSFHSSTVRNVYRKIFRCRVLFKVTHSLFSSINIDLRRMSLLCALAITQRKLDAEDANPRRFVCFRCQLSVSGIAPAPSVPAMLVSVAQVACASRNSCLWWWKMRGTHNPEEERSAAVDRYLAISRDRSIIRSETTTRWSPVSAGKARPTPERPFPAPAKSRGPRLGIH